MDRIISCASRASWLETPQAIDLSIIAQAVLALENFILKCLALRPGYSVLQGIGKEKRRGIKCLYNKPETEEQRDIDYGGQNLTMAIHVKSYVDF